MATRIAHLTTCHERDEVRVFLKECLSLVSMGYDVHLVVADGKGEALVRGVHIHDVGKASGRFARMILLPWRFWKTARKLKARVFHMHEPELLLIALPLKWAGKSVIYDSHEDVPRAILSRDWIPLPLRKFVSSAYEGFENFIASRIAAVVGATPHITKRFSSINPRSITLNNFPLASEVHSANLTELDGRNVCFIGNISAVRGSIEMVKALEGADARLILAGRFETPEIEAETKCLSGWSRVDYRGMVARQEVLAIMAQSRVGLLLYHPEPNHVDAQPNKMFEYMSVGLPVLASDFPLWKSSIDEVRAGICVNALDPVAIAQALKGMLDDKEGSRAMGMRGREAVLTRYQWIYEEPKLAALYQELT